VHFGKRQEIRRSQVESLIMQTSTCQPLHERLKAQAGDEKQIKPQDGQVEEMKSREPFVTPYFA